MNSYLRSLFRFCLLVLLQVIILDKIDLLWWAVPKGFPPFSPHIYQLFLLMLPFETPVWLLLLLGFATGITIDTFDNTAGIHACATVLMAYLRTNVLTALLPRNLSEYSGTEPGIKTMGGIPFLTYAGFLVLVHHLVLYPLLIWDITNLGRLGVIILASSLTTMLLISVYLLLFTRQAALKL